MKKISQKVFIFVLALTFGISILVGCEKKEDMPVSVANSGMDADVSLNKASTEDNSENNVQLDELINDDDNINYFNDLSFEDSCVSIYDFNKPESVGFYKEDGWILNSAEEGITNVSSNTIEPENAVYYLNTRHENLQDFIIPIGLVIGRDKSNLCKKIDEICNTEAATGIRIYYWPPSDMTVEQKEYISKLPEYLVMMTFWHNSLVKLPDEVLEKIDEKDKIPENIQSDFRNFFVPGDIEKSWENYYNAELKLCESRGTDPETKGWGSLKEFKKYWLEPGVGGEFVFVKDVEPIYE